jgi:predicted O-methyltransferase YrrM
VHSPFVFKFVTECLYDKSNYEAYSNIQSYRKELISDKTTIAISDFGAGSQVFTSNKRTISDIAKHSGSSLKKAKILFRISKYFKPKSILELGTSLGIATYALSKGNEGSHIMSIEGCANISNFASKCLSDYKVENITLQTGTFDHGIPRLKQQTFNLVFVDGHHSKVATLKNFETLLSYVDNDTIFIFDDIYWSKEMTEAWEEIKSHQSVTVSIDCFHLGLVFFRREQAKEHFKIRV